MEKLRAKLKENSGFTLVEMLIVVAIIAILIMVSLPLVSGSLEKARQAVDDANERSAKSLGMTYYLTERDEDFTTGVTLYYAIDAGHEGTLVEETQKPEAYGESSDNKNSVIKVTIKEATAGSTDSVVTTEWEAVTAP